MQCLIFYLVNKQKQRNSVSLPLVPPSSLVICPWNQNMKHFSYLTKHQIWAWEGVPDSFEHFQNFKGEKTGEKTIFVVKNRVL